MNAFTDMKHDELLGKIDVYTVCRRETKPGKVCDNEHLKEIYPEWFALRAVVELHKPTDWYGNDSLVCNYCFGLNYERTGLSMEPELFKYPCATIKAIEKELR